VVVESQDNDEEEAEDDKGKNKKRKGKKRKDKKKPAGKTGPKIIPNIEDECKELDRAGVIAKLKLLDAQFRALQATNMQANATIRLLLDQVKELKAK